MVVLEQVRAYWVTELWSSRIHGSYLRFPRDLPTSGKVVVMSLRVRRFLCAEGSCPCKPSRCPASLVDSLGGRSGCARRSSRSFSRSRAGLAPECRTSSGCESAGTPCSG
ncbi:transposase family protein [Streptomyces sparsogenes]|uniref:transposase family protein n=1 Tax=Streptomyces sparsogenes TaxID=67365 RepID=UPI0033E53BAB